jgi:hypothetical protein
MRSSGRRLVRVAGVLALATGSAGCGGAPPPSPSGPISFGAEPLMVLASTAGTKQIAVWTSPQPPQKGVNAVQLLVTDAATGAPLDDLAVQAVPWMPSHAHGTSAKTQVLAEDGGVYQVDNVYLYMDGTWQLRTSLGDDTVVPEFDVP